MSMKAEAYEALAKEESRSLAQVLGYWIEGSCPTCGRMGVSIHFSVADEMWRCMTCEMDSFGC